MRKMLTVLCLMLALGVLLLPGAGQCFWEKPSDVIQDSCSGTGKKILITYDTKHGATALVAKNIHDTLCARNFSVDLVFVEELDADTIPDYDAVIIGSPVYIGGWLPGIKRLLRRHHGKIEQVPTAFFVTCTYIATDTPERQAYALENYVNKNLKDYQAIIPIDVGILAGEFLYEELYPLEFILMKIANFIKEGDYIDAVKIEAWANAVGDKL